MSFPYLVYTLARMRKFPKGHIKIGEHCVGRPYICSNGKECVVTIGNYCSIAPDVIIIPRMMHIPEKNVERLRLSTYPLAKLKSRKLQAEYDQPIRGGHVRIGSDVWIGARAIIMPGVTVGNGAIIGSGAVVTHNVPAYAVVAGVPAKILRYRFNQDQINELLKISWWSWPKAKIIKNIHFFYDDVDGFIKTFKEDSSRSPDLLC